MSTTNIFRFADFFNDSQYSDRVLSFCAQRESVGAKRKAPPAFGTSQHRRVRIKQEHEQGTSKQNGTSSYPGRPVEVEWQLHVSSCVLASHSTYFKALFARNFADSRDKRVVIELEANQIPMAIEAIRYVYKGEFSDQARASPAQYIPSLLTLSERFDLRVVLENIGDIFTKRSLELHECLEILEYPDSVTCLKIFSPIKERVENDLVERFKNFDAIWSGTTVSDSFLRLSPRCMEILLDSDQMNVKSENDTWAALVQWKCHKPDRTLVPLLPHIRFAMMDAHFLFNEVEHSILCALSEEVKAQVAAAYKYKALKNSEYLLKHLPHHNSKIYKPRASYSTAITRDFAFLQKDIQKMSKSMTLTSRYQLMHGYRCCVKFTNETKPPSIFFAMFPMYSDKNIEVKRSMFISDKDGTFKLISTSIKNYHRGSSWGPNCDFAKIEYMKGKVMVRVTAEIVER